MAKPDLQVLCSARRPLPREGESLSPKAIKPDYKVDGNGCWIWQKYRQKKGYGTGRFTALGIKTNWAHVAYWIVANGSRPEGRHIVIDHLCRNHSCVNPKHLEAVEQAVNVHRGKSAKLTMEIAREVRARVAAGQLSSQIRDELGVSIQNVWWIAEDRAWREDPTAPRSPVRPLRSCVVCSGPIPSDRLRMATYCSDLCRQRAYWARRRAREVADNAA
jgi:predicted nucleic acid-binding Zn ribbon protein